MQRRIVLRSSYPQVHFAQNPMNCRLLFSTAARTGFMHSPNSTARRFSTSIYARVTLIVTESRPSRPSASTDVHFSSTHMLCDHLSMARPLRPVVCRQQPFFRTVQVSSSIASQPRTRTKSRPRPAIRVGNGDPSPNRRKFFRLHQSIDFAVADR